MESYKNCVVIMEDNSFKFIEEQKSYKEYIGDNPTKIHFINNIYILYNENAKGDINLYVESYNFGKSNLTKIIGNAIIVNIENNIIKSLEEDQITYLNEVIEDGKIEKLFREYYKDSHEFELDNEDVTILSNKVKEKNLMRTIYYNSKINKYVPLVIEAEYDSITKYITAPIDYVNISETVDCIVYDSFLALEEEFSNVIRSNDGFTTLTKGDVLIVGYYNLDGSTISLKYDDFLNFYNNLIKRKPSIVGELTMEIKDFEGNIKIKKLEVPVITNDFTFINK